MYSAELRSCSLPLAPFFGALIDNRTPKCPSGGFVKLQSIKCIPPSYVVVLCSNFSPHSSAAARSIDNRIPKCPSRGFV
jgi:hypothetical protein